MSIKKKYVDSHWLVFAFQGILALLFGCFAVFTGIKDVSALVAIVGSTLLGLGVIELFNLLYRTHAKETWSLSLSIAVIEVVVALLLLFTLNKNTALHLTIISVYTLIRGVFEILIGFKSVDDSTDKAIWVISGICAAVLGFVILNSGSVRTQAFIQFFGVYMLIFGLANLIYGVHNNEQSHELAAQRKSIAAKAAKSRHSKSAQSGKKKTKKAKQTKR